MPGPADRVFLEGRVDAIGWIAPPAEDSPRRLAATCRAELEWAAARWRQSGAPGDAYGPGSHPSEAGRLAHEVAAARLVNCHNHVVVDASSVSDLRGRLLAQRRAALDMTQREAYRLDCAGRAALTSVELRARRASLRRAIKAFRAAAAHYRQLRAAIDAANRRLAA